MNCGYCNGSMHDFKMKRFFKGLKEEHRYVCFVCHGTIAETMVDQRRLLFNFPIPKRLGEVVKNE